jgi:putative endonuclease
LSKASTDDASGASPRTPILRALLNRWLGDRGERIAARYLRREGLRIITRNYRTPQGEVDLIARDGNTVVFVEVKSRRRGQPAEAVTLEKQRRLTLAALHFLRRHRLLEHPSRFDVVAIVWPDDRRPPQVEHIRDAFPAFGRGQMF